MACADCKQQSIPTAPMYLPAAEYIGPAGHVLKMLCWRCRQRRKGRKHKMRGGRKV